MSFAVLIRRRAQKSLTALPIQDRDRVIDAIRELGSDSRPHGALKLRGRDGWRLRIGSWRVVYEIDDQAATITDATSIADAAADPAHFLFAVKTPSG